VDEISKGSFGEQEICLPFAIGNVYNSRQARMSYWRYAQGGYEKSDYWYGRKE
jgi:hypothetical protein